MPSPSRIPVFSNKVLFKKEILSMNKVEKKITNKPKSNKNIRTDAQIKRVTKGKTLILNKSSSGITSKKLETATIKKHKTITDHRGISAIKRSENNLKNQVEKLEKEILTLKNQVVDLQNKAENNHLNQSNLQTLVDDLKQENKELRSQTDQLSTLLEDNNYNPVTKKPINPIRISLKTFQILHSVLQFILGKPPEEPDENFSEAFENMMKARLAVGQNHAKDLMSSINLLDSICDETNYCLNEIPINFEM